VSFEIHNSFVKIMMLDIILEGYLLCCGAEKELMAGSKSVTIKDRTSEKCFFQSKTQ